MLLPRFSDSFSFSFLSFFIIQQVLNSYLFYTCQRIYVNPSLPIHPTTTTPPHPPLSPLGVHTFVLYICVSISATFQILRRTTVDLLCPRIVVLHLYEAFCKVLCKLLNFTCWRTDGPYTGGRCWTDHLRLTFLFTK